MEVQNHDVYLRKYGQNCSGTTKRLKKDLLRFRKSLCVCPAVMLNAAVIGAILVNVTQTIII